MAYGQPLSYSRRNSKIEGATRLGAVETDWIKWNKLECVEDQLTEILHQNRVFGLVNRLAWQETSRLAHAVADYKDEATDSGLQL